MVTKEQAMAAHYGARFHYTGRNGGCAEHTGPRGGHSDNIVTVRANGACKTWKTRPAEFRLPVKYGMYEYSAIDHHNAGDYHLEADCPLTIEAKAKAEFLAKLNTDLPDVPTSAWPGGYAIGYVTSDGAMLCADCVNDSTNPIHYSERGSDDMSSSGDGWHVVGFQTSDWHDPSDDHDDWNCDHCNKVISAASDANPDAPKAEVD